MISTIRFIKLNIVVLTLTFILLSTYSLHPTQANQPTEVTLTATVSSTKTPKLLKPGDKIGNVLLADPHDLSDALYILPFCDANFLNANAPANCDLPKTARTIFNYLIHGSDQADLEASWKAIDWEFYINEHPIDVLALKTQDYTSSLEGTIWKNRQWSIELDNLTPGKYVFRVIMHQKKDIKFPTLPIFGSVLIQKPGDYTYTFNVNVGEANFATPCPPSKLKITPQSTITPTKTPEPYGKNRVPGYLLVGTRYSACGEVTIVAIFPETWALKTNLEVNDAILALNGVPISDIPGMNIFYDTDAGQVVTYTIERDGKIMDIQVTLDSPPAVDLQPTPTIPPTDF